jgi:hypothetical protein
MFHYQQAWSENEKSAYLQLLAKLPDREVKIQKVMLYSLARQSFQPEAENLRRATLDEMNAFAADIKALGYDVSVNY